MSNAPYFSIIIPTYNRAALIGKTLNSVFAQDFPEFEVIVVDDGSTDNTEEVVRKFSDPRLHYFKRENVERGASRNFGTSQARGRYVNFFDSDDLMYPHHLSTALRSIEGWGSPEFFHLGYDFQTPGGTVIRRVDNFDKSVSNTLLYDNVLGCIATFVRTDIARKFPFEEDRRLASAEDWELWIRLVSRFTLQHTNEVTSSVVSHDQRSIRVIRSDKVITRDLFLIDMLAQDPLIIGLYGTGFKKFKAERYTYMMLCLAIEGKRAQVIRWAWRAFRENPLTVFSARFMASIKKVIIPF